MYKASPGDVSLGSDWDSSMRIGFFPQEDMSIIFRITIGDNGDNN